MMKNFISIIIILFLSTCELPDNTASYEDKLVVFANLSVLQMNDDTVIPIINPVHVSMSSAIDSDVNNTNELYINDAIVEIVGSFDEDPTSIRAIECEYIQGSYGQYQPSENIEYIWPDSIYTLNVSYDDGTKLYEVTASTKIPQAFTIQSIEDSYNCEECSNLYSNSETECENADGEWEAENISIMPINTENFSTIFNDVGLQILDSTWLSNPENLEPYSDIIDTLTLERFGCTVGSFASMPFFVLEFPENNQDAVIKIVSYSLESDKMDLEPIHMDWDEDGIIEEYEFFDYNLNGIYDSTLINTYYDTSMVFNFWKGPYLRDENNNPYLNNPFIWNVESSITPIMWLYFNYYGKHLMFIQSSDGAYYDYLSGDPFGKNQYLLPDSNIESGYGLFSSNYSIPFFIDAKRGIDIKDDWEDDDDD